MIPKNNLIVFFFSNPTSGGKYRKKVSREELGYQSLVRAGACSKRREGMVIGRIPPIFCRVYIHMAKG